MKTRWNKFYSHTNLENVPELHYLMHATVYVLVTQTCQLIKKSVKPISLIHVIKNSEEMPFNCPQLACVTYQPMTIMVASIIAIKTCKLVHVS